MNQTMKTTALLLAAMGMGYLGGLLSQSTHQASAQPTAAPPAVITAQKFALVDAEGKERGSFSLVNGDPCMILSDAKGEARGAFGMEGDNIALALTDSAGRPRWGIAMLGDKVAMKMCSASGKEILRIPKK
jgi:hypothetical protein